MRFRSLAAAVPLALSATILQAQVITPTGTFGPLAAATFGGSGIPNDAVMSSVFNGVTLGLTATGRFANPATTNDGAGTYFAGTGFDVAAPGTYAKWNFDFFIGGTTTGSYAYRLFYDFNPAVGNDVSTHGSILLAPGQDSWNLAMGFLSASVPGLISPPSSGPFDPTADGEYTFALVQYDIGGVAPIEKNRVAIAVDVGNVVATPEPATIALVGTGLLGVIGFARRRRV